MKNEVMFYDIESGEYITAAQLETEFKQLQAWQPEEYNYTFDEYVKNCLTKYNGTLDPIN